MYELIAYIVCILFVASMKMAWFETLLPVHIYHILHKCGLSMGIKDWDSFPEYESTREDWEYKVLGGDWNLLANLLTCPVCLSFHLSFWCSLIVFLLVNISVCVSWLIIPISVFTIPYIVNKFLK